MTLGYDKPLYILAFDHRGSFQKKFFGIAGEPNAGGNRSGRGREAGDLRGSAARARRGG